MRKHNPKLSHNEELSDCITTDGTLCVNTTRNSLKVGQSHSLHSSTFTSISSSDVASGGVLYLHSDDESESTSLMVTNCIFHTCNSTATSQGVYGGGAIYIDCGFVSITHTLFFCCSSAFYGGAIYVYNNCQSSTILHCSFIACHTEHGGAVMTHMGPSSSISSSRFISCSADYVAGGFYHNSNTTASTLTLSDSLFSYNCARYEGNRGGGAFEDRRDFSYISKYSFAFFTGNRAPSGVGNDISIGCKMLETNNIIHCFTTTKEHSLWNVDDYVTDWLQLGTLTELNIRDRKYALKSFANVSSWTVSTVYICNLLHPLFWHISYNNTIFHFF